MIVVLPPERQLDPRMMQAISTSFDKLKTLPDIGRPLPNNFNLREVIINFGDSGYVALYRHDREQDAVYILAFRHQKEAG
ncbi:MAG: type II toxin-antitoxin system RelE/ParE family toxin [Rhodospirillales bacterium]|nr:type II toxin-antitoxin system RelE/ParE family toxin [Rhodospirillales bacterium]